MILYLLRRVLQMVPTLTVIIVASFALIQFVPGDPAATLAGEEAGEATLARVRAEYGLDKPMTTQLILYAGRLLRGDLGQSYSYGQPVGTVIWGALPATVLLTGTALVVSTAVGILLGMFAARRESELMDHAVNWLTLIAFAVPSFWLAQLAILFPVLRWRLFPLEGMVDPSPGAPTGLAQIADIAYHLMLPMMVLAVSEVAAVTRLVRSGLLSEGAREYVRVADAKGLSTDEVISRHVLRNALLPVVTLIGTRIGFLFSGAVVIESLFTWPGLGSVLRSALTTNLDPPLVLGIVITTSVAIVVANLVTDLVYTWIDPRVRLG